MAICLVFISFERVALSDKDSGSSNAMETVVVVRVFFFGKLIKNIR